MIYPTRRMVLAAAAIAPLSLAIGLAAPAFWLAGLALLALLLALALVDAFSGAGIRDAQVSCEGIGAVGVGETFGIEAQIRFDRQAPAAAELAFEHEGPVEPLGASRTRVDLDQGSGACALAFRALRRGTARSESIWIRWQGLLGLVWKQRRLAVGQDILVTPDIRPVRNKGMELLHRDAAHDLMAQLQAGEGSEFEALTDFRQGMDRRSIDWKQSARHSDLIAKEYRTERNNNIVLAIDAGRTMSEPLGALPRLDRAVSAALLTAFVALKGGDRVGLFAFDSRPRASTNAVSGPRAFALLQRVAAGIGYSANETNYTLGMATLATGLSRRSLIVIFTEFADPTGAELMLAAIGPLLKRHLLLFVVLRDEELEHFAGAEPAEPEDVSRAVTAAALLRERRLVLTRLRRLGAHIVEAEAKQAGPALVSAYLDLKRRNRL